MQRSSRSCESLPLNRGRACICGVARTFHWRTERSIHILPALRENPSLATSFVVQDCHHASLQCAVVSGVVVIRDCSYVTLSVCCSHLVVMCVSSTLLTPSNSHHIGLFVYATPRAGLLRQLKDARLSGRNCWDFGIDLKGFRFPCAELPPREFSPFITREEMTEEEVEKLELPLLPKRYEDVFRRVLDVLKTE